MTKNWAKESKIGISIIAISLLCLAIAWIAYALFDSQLIQSVCALLSHLLSFFLICIIGLLICERIGNKKITGGFLYAIIFITSFPKVGYPINITLDHSWQYALNYAFSQNMQFGKDIMFTLGPLGFLSCPQPLGNNLLIGICFHVATYMILVYSIVCLIMSIHREKRALAMAMYATLSFYILANFRFFLGHINSLLISTLILNYDSSKRLIFMYIAAAVISVLFLIKIGWGIVGSLFLGSYLAIKLVREKKYKLFLLPVITGVGIFFALWFYIYNDFSSIANYMFSGFQFIKGYGSAMSVDPSNDSSVIYFLYALFIMMFFAFYAKEKKLYLINSIFLLPSISMFRYAFTRYSKWHTWDLLKFFSVYFFVVLIQKFSVRKKIFFSIICCTLFLMFFGLSFTFPFSTYMRFCGGFKRGVENLYNSSFGYKSYSEKMAHYFETNLQEVALSSEILHEIKNYPVDIYPWHSIFAPANKFNWRFRPVFQSYVAFTPWLDEINSDFMASKVGPVYIVWVTERFSGISRSIDGRYLFNDEPKTIYEIINNYEPILFEKKAVLFKRKEAPTFLGSFELHEEKRRWNEWLNVPSPRENVIRAKIEFTRTLYGKIKRLLWKEKEVFVEYKFKNGEVKKHRLVVDNAISGVWVHPYIKDVSSVLKGATVAHEVDVDERSNLFFGNTVIQIRLSYKDKNTFKPYFTIVWEEIEIALKKKEQLR